MERMNIMRYNDGFAIGVMALVSAAYSVFSGMALPMCLSVGTCVGLAVDAILRRILPRDKHTGNAE